ncbi:MAG TPA: hypothetical protein V6C86_24595 [Oculatellaceae cyanobacterium]
MRRPAAMLDWIAAGYTDSMQASHSTDPKPDRTRKQIPSWLKVLLISFALTFCLGYIASVDDLKKDSGKEGVPHWNQNYWQCMQSCAIDGLMISLPGTALALTGFGAYRLLRKRR